MSSFWTFANRLAEHLEEWTRDRGFLPAFSDASQNAYSAAYRSEQGDISWELVRDGCSLLFRATACRDGTELSETWDLRGLRESEGAMLAAATLAKVASHKFSGILYDPDLDAFWDDLVDAL